MRKRLAVLGLAAFLVGCTPLEKQAYDLFTGTKAGLVKYREKHTECGPYDSVTGLSANVKVEACTLNNRITSGKDALIDAAEVYCSSPSFDANGGACTPPAKGSPAATQAQQKLAAAVSSLQQIIKDAKGAF